MLSSSEVALRTALFLLSWGLVACDGGQSGENPWDPCEGSTSTEVEPTDDTLGFSVNDVLAALTSPVGVEWDEWTQEEWRTELQLEISPSDTLSLSGFALGGQANVVDFAGTRHCRHGQGKKLFMPLALDVELGGGVTAAGTVDLWVSEPSLSEIEAQSSGELFAELSGAYEEAFDAWWLALQEKRSDANDWELQGVHVALVGPWDALNLDLEARYNDSDVNVASVLWRGGGVFED